MSPSPAEPARFDADGSVAAMTKPSGFQPRVGDLLFQDLDCGGICEAIESVTQGVGGSKLSHVAMVVRVDAGKVWVIEAYSEGVVEVPLGELLTRSRDAEGSPKVLVGRLKPAYRALIPSAIEAARARLGRPYDATFTMGDEKHYCSELLHEAFREANGGRPVFEAKPMTFRDPTTGRIAPAWVAYFEKLGGPVPEGEPGLNPGGMSTSPVLSIVHAYGSPDQ